MALGRGRLLARSAPGDLRTLFAAAAGVLGGVAVYTVGTQMVAGAPDGRADVRRRARPGAYAPILEALAAAGMQATFFMIGRYAEAAPEVARAVAAAGHEVGNHTYRHLWTLPPRATVTEVDRGAAAVADATGVFPRYLRPPCGMFNWAGYVRAGQLGETRILWSVRPEGWLSPVTAGEMAARVIRWTHPGAIIGLHDRGGHPTTPRATLAALPGMAAGLRALGYRIVPLGTLLDPAR